MRWEFFSYTGDQQSKSGFEKNNAKWDQDDRQTKEDRQEEEDECQRYFDEKPETRQEEPSGDGKADPKQKRKYCENN